VKLLKQHYDSSGNPLALHPIFFGRKERPENFFYDSEKELKVKGVYWKAGLAQIVKPLNKLTNTHYNNVPS
jgi:hypothetical protein